MANTIAKLYSAAISCEHCVSAIESGIREMPGINGVSVDRDNKMITVDYDAEQLSETAIRLRMKDLGYEVIG
jgi:copper chaperone